MPRRLGVAHTTEESHRVRVSGRRCARGSMRYKTISKKKGIKGLLCCPSGKFNPRTNRCEDGMFMRTVVYDKDKFTKRQAESHAKKRFI